MKPVDLKNALINEIYYAFNMFYVLSDIKKERPYEYNVIESFVKQCKDIRKEKETLIKEAKEENNVKKG